MVRAAPQEYSAYLTPASSPSAMPSSGRVPEVPAVGPVASGWASASASTPSTPTVAPTAQRRDSGWRSTTRSTRAAAIGAEPIDTTVPTATPARRMDV